MSLHGEIKVNHNIIGEWSAQRAGIAGNDYIYRCRINYTTERGYTHERTFWVRHNYNAGALALAGMVMIQSQYVIQEPACDEAVSWHDFCAENNLNPYEALGQHITLKG